MSSPLPEDARLPEPFRHAWRTDVAADAAVRRAYLRFLQGRSTSGRVPALHIAGWVLAGMLLGMGGVYAASAGPWQGFLRNSAAPAHEPAAPREPAPRRTPPHAVIEAPAASAPEPSAPASTTPTPSGRAHLSPAAVASENWQRAARGLRDRDFDSASAALLELEAHAGPAERETAELVRAQLLLSQGQGTEARALLRAVQGGARSPAIRQKASALLAQTTESSAAQRSFPAPAVTHLP